MAHRQPFAAFFDLHQIVIHKANQTIADDDKEHDPYKVVGQIAPQKRGRHDRKYNQQTAHGGCAGL